MVGNARSRQTGNAAEQFALAALRSQSLSGCFSRHRMDRTGMDAWLALFRIWLEWAGSRSPRYLADDPDGRIHRRRRCDVLRWIFKFHSGDNWAPDMAGNAYPGHAAPLRSDSHDGRIGGHFRLRG